MIKKLVTLLLCVAAAAFMLPHCTSLAVTWEFGTSGDGANPFTPRGYVIETENGWFWLSSRYDNSYGDVTYTGELNGVDYVDAKKSDGTNYTLYALTDRNPTQYTYLFAYKNGSWVDDFSYYIGAPGRLGENDRLGSGANWAIPIEGFELEPGCYYEFGFMRGLQANNGITLVFSEDEKGYIQTPETEEELAKYEADKYDEYQFMSSYWVIWNEDQTDYTYEYHLVPMRFSLQTYADLTTWVEGRQAAADFLASVTTADIASGKYLQRNVTDLAEKLESLDIEAETYCKKMLQPDAEINIKLMLAELELALTKAKKPQTENADMDELKALIQEAQVVYREASKKIGDGIGQYNGEAVEKLKTQLDHALTITEKNTQKEVDDEANALSEAITRVYASVTHEPSLILYDYATGVRVVIPSSATPEDTTLFVKVIGENDRVYADVSQDLGAKLSGKKMVLYDISLYSGDIRITPSKKFTVQIPAPEEGISSNVYYSQATGGMGRLASSQADGVKIMTVKSAGYFAIVYGTDEEASPPDKETETAYVAEETDTEIKDDPDSVKKDVDEAPAEEKEVKSSGYDEERTATTPPETASNTDIGDPSNDRSSIPVLWISSALTLAGAILAVMAIRKKDGGDENLLESMQN